MTLIPKEDVDSASASKMPGDLIGWLYCLIKSMGSLDFWLKIQVYASRARATAHS